MNDDARRDRDRERKARYRAAQRGTNVGQNVSHPWDNVGQEWDKKWDKMWDRMGQILSELNRISEQISGATLTRSPFEGGTGECEGAPVPRGTGSGTTRRDSVDVPPRDTGPADTQTDPVWEFDDEGRVHRHTGTRGDDPTIPARTWPDPRRTQEHVDAAENGIGAARDALDRNRWHPSKGAR